MRETLKSYRNQRREVWVAICSILIFAVLLSCLLAFELIQTRHNIIQTGYLRARNLSLALEEQTQRSIQTLDFTLALVSNELADRPSTPSHDPQFTSGLRRELAKLPYVRALFVVGRDGYLIQDTDVGTPNVSLSDRLYFKTQADSPTSALYVGEPLRSRSTQIGSPWFLSVSKGIRLSDGSFYGAVVAAVEPLYFSHFYSELGDPKEIAVALIHSSGLLIARYPVQANSSGVSLADQKLFTTELKAASSGAFSDVSKVDGAERLYSYRTVEPWPLVVAVGLNKELLLADWQRQAFAMCAAAAALIVVLIIAATVIIRRRVHDLQVAEHLHNIDRLESLGQIASTVAHDFNNLLFISGGNIETASRKLPSEHQCQQRLSTALQAVQQGGRMVKDLLSFARHGPAEPTTKNLCEILSREADLLRQAARPCRLAVALPDARCEAVIDENGFERALMNLVVNARHATSTSGVITVTAKIVAVTPSDRRTWPGLASGQICCL